MKIKRPGLRIIKTAIAVFLSLIISHLRSENAIPFYAAIAAIICLKPNVDGTIEIGVSRLIGTLVGGLIGLLYLLILRDIHQHAFLNYFIVSIVMAGLIWAMSVAKRPNAISIMAIVFVSITINHGIDPVFPAEFAFNRVVDTLIGVVIAVIVNWSDFRIRDKVHEKFHKS